jgi:hypothetical protein
VFLISRHVAGTLAAPEVSARCRLHRAPPAIVTVPEAAVDKNRRSILAQHDVWFSGEILSVQSVPKAARVKEGPDAHFRFCIAAFDCRHVPAALLRRVNVNHA